jgi:hypothetical protein
MGMIVNEVDYEVKLCKDCRIYSPDGSEGPDVRWIDPVHTGPLIFWLSWIIVRGMVQLIQSRDFGSGWLSSQLDCGLQRSFRNTRIRERTGAVEATQRQH